MKQFKKIITLFIICLSILSVYSTEKSKLIPQRVILTSTKDQYDEPIEKQLIDEATYILEELDSQSVIIYVKENEWDKHKKQIEDLNNKENLGKFLINTSVTSIISLSIDDRVDKIIIYLFIFDVLHNELFTDSIELFKSGILDELPKYLDFFRKNIQEKIKPIDVIELRKSRLESRIKNRKSPEYELYLSGGAGYYSQQSLGGNTYSLGFSPYIEISGKALNLAYGIHGEFSPLFNNPPLDDNYFLYNTFTSLDLGGWFAKETFSLGMGFGVSVGSYYYENRYDENDYDKKKIETLSIALLIPYLNFSFLPIRRILISIDIGSFFSPTHLESLMPSQYFPLFVRLGLKCVIYKGFFLELSIPYYQFQIDLDNHEELMGLIGMVKIGCGWRFEWGEWK